MTGRSRILGLVLIALAVPFPALALDGGGAESDGPASLSVSASLDLCGTVEARIVCKIDAGWSGIEDADHYEVSVVAADGSVVDFGSLTGQSTSLYVPYVGAGTYSVRVSAWGTPPGEEEPELMARDVARSTSAPGGKGSGEAASVAVEAAGTEVLPDESGDESAKPTAEESGSPAADPVEDERCEEPPEPEAQLGVKTTPPTSQAVGREPDAERPEVADCP